MISVANNPKKTPLDPGSPRMFLMRQECIKNTVPTCKLISNFVYTRCAPLSCVSCLNQSAGESALFFVVGEYFCLGNSGESFRVFNGAGAFSAVVTKKYPSLSSNVVENKYNGVRFEFSKLA